MSKIYSQDIKLIRRKNSFLKGFGVFLLVNLILTIIFFGGVGISNLLYSRGFTWFKSNKIILNSENYYVISFGEYDTEKEALDCAIWTGTSGGAAYVYQQEKFLVAGQLYDNVDNANNVLENFSNDLTYSASIKQYKTDKISFKIEGLEAKDKRIIEKNLNLIHKTISNVLEVSNKIDTNVCSNVSASSEINALKSDVKIAKTSLDSVNVNYGSDKLKSFGDLFVKIIDSLDVCVNKLLTSENYSNVCKYCACEIFFNYYDFSKNLVK